MEMTPDLLLLVGVIAVVLWLMTKKPANYPPGPTKWPVVGNLLQMKVDGQLHPVISKMHEKYGDVVGMFVGDCPIVLVSGFDAIHEVCFREDMIGRPENKELKLLCGGNLYGIGATVGEVWKEQRRFTLHHMRNLGFGKRTSEGIIQEEVKASLEEIDKMIGDANLPNLINFHDILGGPTVNVIWHMMSGTRFDNRDPKFRSLINSIIEYFKSANPDGGLLTAFPLLAKLFPFLTPMKTLKQSYDNMISLLQETIDEHRKTIDHDHPRDFIDIYLTEIENQKEVQNTSFHIMNLLHVCSDFFSAGTDTTMSTLKYAFLYMILHPMFQKKVQDEIDHVIGRDRLPSLEDRAKLPYVEATLNEILRLSSIGPIAVPHAPYTSKKELSFRGYKIPKNTTIILNLYDLHHDPKLWNNPFEFIPERFLNGSGQFIKNEALIPFGTGKRVCVGKSLAQNNIFLFFSSIMQRYTLSIPEGQPKPSMKPEGNMILHPVHFEVKVKLRV